jgi:hypothetical protein
VHVDMQIGSPAWHKIPRPETHVWGQALCAGLILVVMALAVVGDLRPESFPVFAIPGIGLATGYDVAYLLLATLLLARNGALPRRTVRRLNSIALFALIVFVILLIVGYCHQNKMGSVASDFRVIVGVCAALAFLKHFGDDINKMHKIVLLLCMVGNIMTALTIVYGGRGGELGFDRIGASNGYYTLLTFNFAWIGWILIFPSGSNFYQYMSVAVLVLTVVEALVSQTRSYVLALVVLAGLVGLSWLRGLGGNDPRLRSKRRRRAFWVGCTVVVLGGVGALGYTFAFDAGESWAGHLRDSILYRFANMQEDVNYVTRQNEVDMMLTTMSGLDWMTGRGAGATYYLEVGDQFLELQSAHIAAATVLLKGGVGLFAVFCIWLPARAGWRFLAGMLSADNSERRIAVDACDVSTLTLFSLLYTSFAWGEPMGFYLTIVVGTGVISRLQNRVPASPEYSIGPKFGSRA